MGELAERVDFLGKERPVLPEGLAPTYDMRLALHRAGGALEAGICFCFRHVLPLEAVARLILSAEEQKYFDGLVFERRRRSYLIGRYVAKKAITLLSKENPEDIHIEYGVFSFPIIKSLDGCKRLDVSISHSSDAGAAVAFPSAHPMGIDIEKIDPDRIAVIDGILTSEEKVLFGEFAKAHGYVEMLTAAWTAKESLSKVFKTGLTANLSTYEIDNINWDGSVFVSLYKNFGQYKAVSFIIGDYVCSITCPKNTEIDIDVVGILAVI